MKTSPLVRLVYPALAVCLFAEPEEEWDRSRYLWVRGWGIMLLRAASVRFVGGRITSSREVEVLWDFATLLLRALSVSLCASVSFPEATQTEIGGAHIAYLSIYVLLAAEGRKEKEKPRTEEEDFGLWAEERWGCTVFRREEPPKL